MADTNTLPSQIPSGLSGISGAVGVGTSFLNSLASFVTSTSDLIKKVSDFLPNETRSIVVEVDNLTAHRITNITHNFSSVGFGQTLPPPPRKRLTNCTVDDDAQLELCMLPQSQYALQCER